jgi:phytanoyl-CoA hydroxylase
MRILGSIDRCDEVLIEGWIIAEGDADTKLGLELTLDGEIFGRCTANQFRQDLKDAQIGDGECAFSFPTPAFIPRSETKRITVRLENSNVILPQRIEADSSMKVGISETVSRFGGLWIDRHDWLDRLAAMHRKGRISDELSMAIFQFVRDGYFVIKGAVSPAVVDKLNDEIGQMWKSPPNGLLVETFEPDGQMRCIPPNVTFRAGRTKLLDLYVFSRIAREAIASPKVVAFLTCIFSEQPKAFQGLTFWNGSQQAIHKDTAYVKVDSNPMHLAATWLALEDVAPGTGELEYYVGSHRAPDFLFGGTSKWMESHTSEHERFLQSLHDDAISLGHRKSSFLAKKGDVLIWHADLAHGGSPIEQPVRTRKSLVTHFTPASDEPFYRRSTNYRSDVTNGCCFVSQYADVGS